MVEGYFGCMEFRVAVSSQFLGNRFVIFLVIVDLFGLKWLRSFEWQSGSPGLFQ